MEKAIVIVVTVLRMATVEFEKKLADMLKRRRASKVIDCTVTHLEEIPSKIESHRYVPPMSRFEVSLNWGAAIPGHTLLAHMDLSNGIVTSFGGELSQAEYKRMDGRCELCNQDRERKHQFLVRDDATQATQVVGGSCARKFCGTNLENVVASMNYIEGAIKEAYGEESESWGSGNASSLPFDVRLVLASAEHVVKTIGWTSRQNATDSRPATAEFVFNACCDALWGKHYNEESKKAVQELAQAARDLDLAPYKAFVANELATKWSDLAQSWQNMLDCGDTDFHGFGRLSYLVVAMGRSKDNKQRKAYQPEAGLGKMHDFPGQWTVVNLKANSSEWGDYLAVTAQDSEGRTVWFKSTKKTTGVKLGQTFQLRGKVTGIKDTISFMSHASVIK